LNTHPDHRRPVVAHRVHHERRYGQVTGTTLRDTNREHPGGTDA
jgi:hypothetical protein